MNQPSPTNGQSTAPAPRTLMDILLGEHPNVDAALTNFAGELKEVRDRAYRDPLPTQPTRDVPGHRSLPLYRKKLN